MAEFGPLIGRPSMLTIRDNEGNIIVKEGEIITPGVVAAARDADRLQDLMLNITMVYNTDIQPASKYVEIGEEDPRGAHPE